MANAQNWTCDCGAVEIRVGLRSAARVVCYCKDCRALARHLDHEEILNDAGGTEVVQTLPESLAFLRGNEHLGCVNMSGADRLRWYATCCKTPIGTTLTSRFIPYISVIAAGLEDAPALGVIAAHAHRKHATARIEGDTGNMNKVMAGMVWRAVMSFATLGPWRSPFRDRNGRAIVEVQSLSDAERARAYDPVKQS